MREPVQMVLAQPNLFQQFDHSHPDLVVRQAECVRSGSATMSKNSLARAQRRERVLEDDLHLPPQTAQVFPRERHQVLLVEEDLAFRRFNQPQQHPPQGGLPAARLAHQPEHLTLPNRQVYARDSVHIADIPGQPTAGQPEVLFQVFGFYQSIHKSHPLMRLRNRRAVLIRNRVQTGGFFVTPRKSMGAARGEGAAHHRPGVRGNGARDRDHFCAAGLGPRDRLQQTLRIRVLGVV